MDSEEKEVQVQQDWKSNLKSQEHWTQISTQHLKLNVNNSYHNNNLLIMD